MQQRPIMGWLALQKKHHAPDSLVNIFYGDGIGGWVYYTLCCWAEYETTKTKIVLRDGTEAPWGQGFVLTTGLEIANLHGFNRSLFPKILKRLSSRLLIKVVMVDQKKGTIIQVLNYDEFIFRNITESEGIRKVDITDSSRIHQVASYNNITIPQSNNVTNLQPKQKTGGPGENSPSPVTAEAGDVSIFDPNDSNDLQTITRTEELQIVGGMDLDCEIKVPVKKRTRTKRPKTHVIAPEGGWPVSLYSAAEKLLQIAIFYYPHLQTSDTFTIDAFAHSLSKVCRSLGKESEFATLLATFIDDSDFWRRIACVPHSLLDKGKGGLRKIDHIYTQMSKKYASSLETIQRSKQFDFEAYRNDPSRSWLYEDPKPLDSK